MIGKVAIKKAEKIVNSLGFYINRSRVFPKNSCREYENEMIVIETYFPKLQSIEFQFNSKGNMINANRKIDDENYKIMPITIDKKTGKEV